MFINLLLLLLVEIRNIKEIEPTLSRPIPGDSKTKFLDLYISFQNSMYKIINKGLIALRNWFASCSYPNVGKYHVNCIDGPIKFI